MLSLKRERHRPQCSPVLPDTEQCRRVQYNIGLHSAIRYDTIHSNCITSKSSKTMVFRNTFLQFITVNSSTEQYRTQYRAVPSKAVHYSRAVQSTTEQSRAVQSRAAPPAFFIISSAPNRTIVISSPLDRLKEYARALQ